MTPPRLGAHPDKAGTEFAVWSSAAEAIWLCLFDDNDRETSRLPMVRGSEGLFGLHVPGVMPGQRYGLRADGPYAPESGLWFDPDKLLFDPYATAIDRAYRYDARLAASRGQGADTAPLMPKAIVRELKPVVKSPVAFSAGGLIYEVNVRAFSMCHPDVPLALRGTVAALAHPAIIAHLKALNVSAVELMPITAWLDERHLPPLGLTNGWGYNPVSFMALDPRVCPGGLDELRDTVATLKRAGIATFLDVVFNHTGESDIHGPTLSLRGLDANAYYRRKRTGKLANDTGTGNTLACDHPATQRLVMDSLRHFVIYAGIEGFRFDLAPVLGRDASGFDPDAQLLRLIKCDDVLADRVLIAEPWDIGKEGYQLGRFGSRWIEWNDRYRDDIRRFWRGDKGMVGALATRLAGSSDVFGEAAQTTTRSVNYIASHDGMTLADITAFEQKHNEANGEHNRDGHGDNLSWNNGAEGPTQDQAIIAARRRDLFALAATLFASRGAIMLTAGDEFARTQRGNNNAYCQDNDTTWLAWTGRDQELETYVSSLAQLRARFGCLRDTAFLKDDRQSVEWRTETGDVMIVPDWEDAGRRRLVMLMPVSTGASERLAIAINGDRRATSFQLPRQSGHEWHLALAPPDAAARALGESAFVISGRSVVFFVEQGTQ